MAEDQESALIAEISAGSHEAFSRFVRLHQSFVRAYIGRFIRNAETVDDLAQETFLSAYRSMSTFRGESSLRSWLLGIARNHALMFLREDQRRRARGSQALDAAVAGWLAESLASREESDAQFESRLSALQGCLKTLPEESAGLISEYYFKGRKAIDIARSVGKSETAMGVALLRVRLALRRCIEGRLASGTSAV